MKKILTLIFLSAISIPVMAATMGAYIDLVHNLKRLETSTNGNVCKKEIIGLSNDMISAANQTMAETIMFMMAEADRNKNPIFCPPKGFWLSASAVEGLMIAGYEKSNLPLDKKILHLQWFLSLQSYITSTLVRDDCIKGYS